MTGAERQKAWHARREAVIKRKEETLAKIAEISTDPVARKMAEMALKGEEG